MGTGSSKARRRSLARSCGASRRGSGSSSAPAVQDPAEEGGGCAAPAEARSRRHQAPSPATEPAEPDSDSDAELLDQVLAECRECDDGHQPRFLRLPGRSTPRLDAGDTWSQPAGGDGGERGMPRDPQVFLPRSLPDTSKLDNKHPLKKPERQATITYDYSEEELMASIEQEYCR